MKHKQHRSNVWLDLFKMAVIITLFLWACGSDTNVQPATTPVYLDIDPGEQQAISTDSAKPDNALLWRDKDGIPHVTFNYSK